MKPKYWAFPALSLCRREKIRLIMYLEEMPSQGVLGGSTLCLNPQEQPAVKILMIFAVFGSFIQTNC